MSERVYIFGYHADVMSENELLEAAKEFIKSHKKGHFVTLNPEMIMQGRKYTALSNALKSSDISIVDGIGIVYSLKIKGINAKRIPGIEFSERLLKLCSEEGYNVGILGASEDSLSSAIKNLKEKYPKLNISYSRNGFFGADEEENIVKDIKKADVKVLFVALGVPKQEVFINNYKNDLDCNIMVGVGGSIDVWGQKVKRAPLFMRKIGLEWLYRVSSEPWRLKRIFPSLPKFFLEVIMDKDSIKREQ